MPAGLDHLKHIVVLMMENRSFDHMLGGLSLVTEKGKKKYPKINGLTGSESNPDLNGTIVTVQPNAKFQGQLDHDPDHHFRGVDLQIFGTANQGPERVANMQGFIKSYATEDTTVDESRAIMYYFSADQLPVLSRLATEYATFNGWFASIPGPTICNRAFAHYGTSFGNVDMNLFYVQDPIVSIYERMIQSGHTAKIYYYDQQSSTMEIVNLLKNQPQIFGSYSQFIADCEGIRCRITVLLSPATTIIPGQAADRFLLRISTPITTCRRARGSSRTPTMRFEQSRNFGKPRRCLLRMTSMVGFMTTSCLRTWIPISRMEAARREIRPAPGWRSTSTAWEFASRRFWFRRTFRAGR